MEKGEHYRRHVRVFSADRKREALHMILNSECCGNLNLWKNKQELFIHYPSTGVGGESGGGEGVNANGYARKELLGINLTAY